MTLADLQADMTEIQRRVMESPYGHIEMEAIVQKFNEKYPELKGLNIMKQRAMLAEIIVPVWHKPRKFFMMFVEDAPKLAQFKASRR